MMRDTEMYVDQLMRYLIADDAPESCRLYALSNLVQGLMLQHLVCRISNFYGIQDSSFRSQLTVKLAAIFGKELFEPFRNKIESDPSLIVGIAKKLVMIETRKDYNQNRVNSLYLSLFLRYLRYDNLGDIIRRLQSDAEIQKDILRYLAKSSLMLTPSVVDTVIQHDHFNILTRMFIWYGRAQRSSQHPSPLTNLFQRWVVSKYPPLRKPRCSESLKGSDSSRERLVA